jgi:hypothetical protein
LKGLSYVEPGNYLHGRVLCISMYRESILMIENFYNSYTYALYNQFIVTSIAFLYPVCYVLDAREATAYVLVAS